MRLFVVGFKLLIHIQEAARRLQPDPKSKQMSVVDVWVTRARACFLIWLFPSFSPPSVSTSRYRHNNRFFAGDSIIGIFFFNCEASNHSNVSLSNDLGLKVNSEIEIGPSEIETRSTLTYSFFYEKWKVEVIKPKICFYCCGHPTWFMNAWKTARKWTSQIKSWLFAFIFAKDQNIYVL